MNHEEATIRAFILPERRRRYVELMSIPKHRKKLLSQFAHFKHLDPRFTFSLPKECYDAASAAKVLTSMGAGPKCWVISEAAELDAREMDLIEALKKIFGRRIGAILSCVPGRLAYFEDEDERYILRR